MQISTLLEDFLEKFSESTSFRFFMALLSAATHCCYDKSASIFNIQSGEGEPQPLMDSWETNDTVVK